MTPKILFQRHNLFVLGDLVKLLQSLPQSKYFDRKEESIRSFLSQTMNGERKLSDDLKFSIIACFKERNESLDEDKFSTEIDEAFDEVFRIRKAKNYSDKEGRDKKVLGVKIIDQKDYDALQKYTRDAQTVTIITAEPAEVKNNSLANKLKQALLEKVGIIDSNAVQAKYSFYLSKGGPSYSIPLNFWNGLYKYALQEQVDNINEKFIEANKEFLKVYAVSDDEIDVTHGIIDENTPKQIGFITIYNELRLEQHEEEMFVVREVNGNLKRVLKRLEKIKKGDLTEFTFSEALEIINR